MRGTVFCVAMQDVSYKIKTRQPQMGLSIRRTGYKRTRMPASITGLFDGFGGLS